jgi:hypothetical protein
MNALAPAGERISASVDRWGSATPLIHRPDGRFPVPPPAIAGGGTALSTPPVYHEHLNITPREQGESNRGRDHLIQPRFIDPLFDT